MSTDAVWKAWVEAHHANGCAERNRTDAEHCRYRAAHIKTAKQIADILEAEGWRLCRINVEVQSVPMFGDL